MLPPLSNLRSQRQLLWSFGDGNYTLSCVLSAYYDKEKIIALFTIQ